MSFLSTSYWMERDYEIEVIFGEFQDKEEARLFGAEMTQALTFYQGDLVLTLKDGQKVLLTDTNINVSRIKKSSIGKLVIGSEDFEHIDLPISEFKKTFGNEKILFQSMSYGVYPDQPEEFGDNDPVGENNLSEAELNAELQTFFPSDQYICLHFFVAARNGNEKRIRELLSQGANIDATCEIGGEQAKAFTAAALLASINDMDSMDRLLEFGASKNKAVFGAGYGRKFWLADFLVAEGAQPKYEFRGEAYYREDDDFYKSYCDTIKYFLRAAQNNF